MKKIKKFDEINEKDKNNDLFITNCARINSREEIQKDIDNGADVNYMNWAGKTPIYVAIYNDNFETIKCLIDNGADVNVVVSNKDYPILTLIQTGTFTYYPLKYIIEHSKFKINFDIMRGIMSPLIAAISKNKYNTIK